MRIVRRSKGVAGGGPLVSLLPPPLQTFFFFQSKTRHGSRHYNLVGLHPPSFSNHVYAPTQEVLRSQPPKKSTLTSHFVIRATIVFFCVKF